MYVYRGFHRSLPLTPASVVTLGNFDGVHLGHAAMLARLRQLGQQHGLPTVVLTFEPHPREFFAPNAAPARLTTLREKLELLAEHAVECVNICRFNAAFSRLSAAEFVEQVLVNSLHVKHLLVGDDFRFGAGRQGDFAFLQAAGETYGFSVEAMRSVVNAGGERVSSSAVRQALAAGDMDLATQLLGRHYAMDGNVVHGDKIGRQLGFATANIRIKHNPLPLAGVFAVEVVGIGAEPLAGVANLGTRPTLGGMRTLLEVHLFDFAQDIYGKHLRVNFLHKLRNEQRFPNFDALKAQIARDAAEARAYFQR